MDTFTSEKTRRAPVDKYLNNVRRREYYALHKEEINKRRRELYAEKKRLSKLAKADTLGSTGGGVDEQASASGNGANDLPMYAAMDITSSIGDACVRDQGQLPCHTEVPVQVELTASDNVADGISTYGVMDISSSRGRITSETDVNRAVLGHSSNQQFTSYPSANQLAQESCTVSVRTSSYTVSKDSHNRKCREYYASHKGEINKRRQLLYAEKKKLSKGATVGTQVAVGDSHGCQKSTFNEDIDNDQIGETSNVGVGISNSHVESYTQQNRRGEDHLFAHDATCIPIDCRLIEKVIRNLNKKDQCRGNLGEYICSSLPSTDDRTIVLPKRGPCPHCKAYKFYKETERFCCSAGEIAIAGTSLPYFLIQLITGTDSRCKQFQNMIRTYNNHFAFTSIGMKCDETLQRRNQGIYTVKVQGQVHHYLNDLMPNRGINKLQGIQFYFYDSDHQVENRLTSLPRLDPSIVIELVDLMKRCNPYTEFLKQASELEDIDQYRIIIRCDPGLDQRTFNTPTSSEVAGIWLEDESNGEANGDLWDIRVYTKSGHSQNVQYYYGCYDPLQYVLMFPKGETGWHGNIPKVGRCMRRGRRGLHNRRVQDFLTFEELLDAEQEGITRSMFRDELPNHDSDIADVGRGRNRATVSCREYYLYRLQIRPNDRSYLLRFGRLLQQYVVDNYIKLETMRLDYLKRNQEKTRIDHYQGLIDSVIAGIPKGDRIGKRVYLPATFIGGPRDLKNRYLDCMAFVQEHGKPDIFLTMTCNPNWPEIKELLHPGEESQNRPDLLARVFKAKLSILHDMLMKGEIFGKIASIVHVVEFQKRGLPHAHFLIILKPAYKYLTPEAYDRIVCAELPDESEQKYLYGLVVKHMMHGPCGQLNPENVCMKAGFCKNHYPKEFSQFTTHGKGTYPIYRRRDTKRKAKVRGKVLDNRWVIPYNPTLLVLFNCHINVELCCDIRAVKYLYKYIHKGHDKVMFRISPECSGSSGDEIEDFQKGRWVSPVEAAWRIYGYPLHDMYPPVLQLQVHTPNFQTIAFEEDTDLEKLLEDARLQRSMLTEFFRINRDDPLARQLNLLYKQFPKYYVWDTQARTWSRRKKRPVVGRLAVVNPVENERYYLRVLLNNVRCPTSFDQLLMVDGTVCQSFQEAALKRGLLHNDNDIDKTMQEASIYKMPSELRRLFATLLNYCRPSNAKKLYQDYFEQMAEDFRRLQHRLNLTQHELECKVLQGINDTLESLGRDINDFHLVSFKYKASDFERYTREIACEKSIPIPEEDLRSLNLLNSEQKKAFDIIYDRAIANTGGLFFVDGPGGTGKSFLYKVLLAHIRSMGFIGLIVASSGIAASNFLGGRTAHSRFKIPIDADAGVRCQIKKQSCDADLIRSSRIIIWDEAPMAHKAIIHALDVLLKDICDCTNPFGGKLVVFGGDFRQVLPVVKGGDKRAQIQASLISSDLWQQFVKLELTDNMRARYDPGFVDYLMKIGNGEEPTNVRGGQFMGKHVWIPRIPLETNPSDNKYAIPFIRRQIPLRLCFAMTINKSQGQTLDYVGIYLRQPVFSHGQLYVALSRAKTGNNVKLLLIPPAWNDPPTQYTRNVVYREIFERGSPREYTY